MIKVSDAKKRFAKRLACVCGKSYYTKSALETHIQIKHAKELSFNADKTDFNQLYPESLKKDSIFKAIYDELKLLNGAQSDPLNCFPSSESADYAALKAKVKAIVSDKKSITCNANISCDCAFAFFIVYNSALGLCSGALTSLIVFLKYLREYLNYYGWHELNSNYRQVLPSEYNSRFSETQLPFIIPENLNKFLVFLNIRTEGAFNAQLAVIFCDQFSDFLYKMRLTHTRLTLNAPNPSKVL